MFLNITLVMVCYKQGIFSQQLGMYLENLQGHLPTLKTNYMPFQT